MSSKNNLVRNKALKYFAIQSSVLLIPSVILIALQSSKKINLSNREISFLVAFALCAVLLFAIIARFKDELELSIMRESVISKQLSIAEHEAGKYAAGSENILKDAEQKLEASKKLSMARFAKIVENEQLAEHAEQTVASADASIREAAEQIKSLKIQLEDAKKEAQAAQAEAQAAQAEAQAAQAEVQAAQAEAQAAQAEAQAAQAEAMGALEKEMDCLLKLAAPEMERQVFIESLGAKNLNAHLDLLIESCVLKCREKKANIELAQINKARVGRYILAPFGRSSNDSDAIIEEYKESQELEHLQQVKEMLEEFKNERSFKLLGDIVTKLQEHLPGSSMLTGGGIIKGFCNLRDKFYGGSSVTSEEQREVVDQESNIVSANLSEVNVSANEVGRNLA